MSQGHSTDKWIWSSYSTSSFKIEQIWRRGFGRSDLDIIFLGHPRRAVVNDNWQLATKVAKSHAAFSLRHWLRLLNLIAAAAAALLRLRLLAAALAASLLCLQILATLLIAAVLAAVLAAVRAAVRAAVSAAHWLCWG